MEALQRLMPAIHICVSKGTVTIQLIKIVADNLYLTNLGSTIRVGG